ncbi:MAG: TrmJ/YjtD family RNA methyltransferase [Sphingomonadaceae bacterium]
MSFWTYILRLSNGSYYTGHSDDLERRIAQHRRGEIKGYTQDKRPIELMWSEEFATRAEALEAELRIKKWSRAKKEALIAGDWQKLKNASIPPGEREARASPPLGKAPRLRSGRTEGLSSGQAEEPGSERTEEPNLGRADQLGSGEVESPGARRADKLGPDRAEELRADGADNERSPLADPHTVRVEPVSSAAEKRSRDTSSSTAEKRGRDAPTPVIVLVRPQLGENIGKAARAMLNFGLADMRLVAPRDGWPNPDAGPAAAGADSVLEKARVFASVADAVADCGHVYATTVRKRGLAIPVATPEEAARAMHAHGEASAILFGAERSGLDTEEVAIASMIITVPVNPDFGSLNLAQAVILIAYEFSRQAGLAMPTAREEDEPRAPQAELDGLIAQLESELEAAGYFHPPERTRATRNTIRTMLTKAGWSRREVQALRGIVRALSGRRDKA